jgi:hypothetical protein
MSDNDSGLGAGQIRVMSHHRTEVQLRPFEGFTQDEISPRSPFSLTSEGGRSLQLAKPYPWTDRDDLNCIGQYDRIDTGDRGEAKALCAGCPVITECLDSALEEETDKDGRPLSHHSRFLVRGGLTPRGRLDEHRRRFAEAAVTESTA